MPTATMAPTGFGILDYCIFALTIAMSLGIGLYSALKGRKQDNTTEFLVASRNMKVIPVALSLLVSYESSIMMLGVPADVYVHGFSFAFAAFMMGIGMFVAGVFIVPLFHNLKVVSAYEYVQGRFGSRLVRFMASSLGFLKTLFYMGIVLYGPATALEAVSGFSYWYSIVVVAVAAMFYTSLGGMRAVVWTDVFQSVVMLGGLLSIVIMGTVSVGGVSEVIRVAGKGRRLSLSFDTDPRVRATLWGMILGSGTDSMRVGIDQTSVQRIATMPTLKKARRLFFIMSPGFVLTLMIACIQGLLAYVYYEKLGCDPLTAGYIRNPNQIMPYFVLELFRDLPGLPGLFMAALFSASLSTLSSGYGSLSAIAWTDYIKPVFPNLTEKRATVVTKILVVVCGLASVGVAIMVQTIGGSMVQVAISILSSFNAPVLGMFLLASLFSQSNYKGAAAGMLVSAVICLWRAMGSSFSGLVVKAPWKPFTTANCSVSNVTVFTSYMTSSNDTVQNMTSTIYDSMAGIGVQQPVGFQAGLAYFYSMSFFWTSPIGVYTTIAVGLIVSALTGCNRGKPVDSVYLIPFVDMVCCCLPRKLQSGLRFRADKRHSDMEPMAYIKVSNEHMAESTADTIIAADHEYVKVSSEETKEDNNLL